MRNRRFTYSCPVNMQLCFQFKMRRFQRNICQYVCQVLAKKFFSDSLGLFFFGHFFGYLVCHFECYFQSEASNSSTCCQSVGHLVGGPSGSDSLLFLVYTGKFLNSPCPLSCYLGIRVPSLVVLHHFGCFHSGLICFSVTKKCNFYVWLWKIALRTNANRN